MDERDIQYEEATFGKERVGLTPNNSILFRHLGASAMFDHVFVTWPNKDETKPERWGYIWSDHRLFNKIAERAITLSLTQHLNLKEAGEDTVDTWVRHHSKDLDTDKLDWLPEV